MNYVNMIDCDVVNGTGIGATLFVSGCPHHCPNCFNREAWDYNYGNSFNDEALSTFLKICSQPHIDHISILGGEPLAQGQDMVDLLTTLKTLNKPIWVWSGYTYEEILKLPYDYISHIDILVDGRFISSLSSPTLQFRGSSNQRIIDVKKSKRKPYIISSFL